MLWRSVAPMNEQQARPADLRVTNLGAPDAVGVAGSGHVAFDGGLDVAAALAAVSGLEAAADLS